MTREDENSLVSVNLSFHKITDRAVYKIENVPSFCPYSMDRKLPNTSVYDVPTMRATYAPLDKIRAASDAVYAALDNVYATLRNMDAFPDDRIVAVATMDKDERVAIAMDRKDAVDKVSKKQGDEEKRKRS